MHEYSNIFEYSSRFYTITHSPTNVRIYSYKQIWHERMSEYICKKIDTNECPNIYSWPIYSNIRIYSSHSGLHVYYLDLHVYYLDEHVYYLDLHVYYLDEHVYYLDLHLYYPDLHVYYLDQHLILSGSTPIYCHRGSGQHLVHYYGICICSESDCTCVCYCTDEQVEFKGEVRRFFFTGSKFLLALN